MGRLLCGSRQHSQLDVTVACFPESPERPLSAARQRRFVNAGQSPVSGLESTERSAESNKNGRRWASYQSRHSFCNSTHIQYDISFFLAFHGRRREIHDTTCRSVRRRALTSHTLESSFAHHSTPHLLHAVPARLLPDGERDLVVVASDCTAPAGFTKIGLLADTSEALPFPT